MPGQYACGSRSRTSLSPLRGSISYWEFLPGAHAPGYASTAAPRLTGISPRSCASSHRIPDEPNVLTWNVLTFTRRSYHWAWPDTDKTACGACLCRKLR